MGKKKLFFLGNLFMLLLFTIFAEKIREGKTINGSMNTAEKLQQTLEHLTEREFEFQLLYEDHEVPYEAENDLYYFPVSEEAAVGQYCFELRDSGQKLIWCQDGMWNQMETAVRDGYEFTFFVIDEESYRQGKIVFTGTSIISIHQAVMEEVEQINCHVAVFEASADGSEENQIIESYGYYEVRGQTSQRFPKKGYNLELYTEKGTENQQSLLGLREDDDWKLNALYTDRSKVREMVANKLWGEIADSTELPYDEGTSMEYAELFVNGVYCGLYGLMEPVDYKQLSLNKGRDVIFKASSFITEENNHAGEFDNRGDYCGQVIKSGTQEITEELWQPMIEYIDITGMDFYKGESCDPVELWNYIREHMNVENLLNFELFLQAIYAQDNEYKNQYTAVVQNEEKGYCLWKVPWDLNYSFGDCYDGEQENLTTFQAESSTKVMNRYFLTELLRDSGILEFTQCLEERWKQLRENLLAENHILELAEIYYQEIDASGALKRDSEKWGTNPENSVKEIGQYYKERVDYLDHYYR